MKAQIFDVSLGLAQIQMVMPQRERAFTYRVIDGPGSETDLDALPGLPVSMSMGRARYHENADVA